MAYEGLLSGLADEDKYLGLLGIGLGLLSGNQGRSRQQAFANAMGGAAQGGLGLLGPIMQNKQAQAQAAMAAKKLGLEERQVGAYEAANTANAALHRAQAEALARQQRILEREFPSEQAGPIGPTGLLLPKQPEQAMIDAGGGAYMQTAPMVQQAAQQRAPGVRDQLGLDKLLRLRSGGIDIDQYLKLREQDQPKVHEGGFVGTTEDLGRFRGQFAPRLIAGQGGEVTQIQPDGRGSVQVTAPGLEAFRQMQDVRNRSAADLEIVDVKLPSGEVKKMTRAQQADWVRGQNAPPTAQPIRPQGGMPVIPPPAPGTAERRAFEQVEGTPAGVPQRATAPVDQNYQKLIESFVRGGIPPTSAAPGYTGPAEMPGVTTGPTAAQTALQEAQKAQQIKAAQERGIRQDTLFATAYQAPQHIQRLQLMQTLLGDFEGGKFTPAGYELARAFNSAGIKIDPKLPNKEAAQALGKELTLELRTAGGSNQLPGPMSDADRQFLEQMTPSMAQSAAGRNTLIAARTALSQRQMEIGQMAQKYIQKYGSLDEEFFSQAARYNTTNPIFRSVKIPGSK